MAVFVVRTERRPGVVRFVVRWQQTSLHKQTHLGSFKTKTEAALRREWAEREIASGREPDPASIGRVETPRLVSDVYGEFLASYKVDTAASSVRSLEQRAVPVLKAVGHLAVSDVTPAVVQALIIDQQADGKANRTVRGRVSVLRQILRFAGVAPNPCDADVIRKPKNKGKRITVPTPAEQAAVLPLLRADHRAVVEWISVTGMRISEAVALSWGDVHPELDAVRVEASKTEAGERWIVNEPDAPFTLPVRPEGVEDWQRVFPVTSGGAVQQGLANACKTAGVRRLGPHSWRHLHLSTCIRNGMDVVRVAARAGHTNPTITLSVYAHLIEPKR